jgi:hypothetical protein
MIPPREKAQAEVNATEVQSKFVAAESTFIQRLAMGRGPSPGFLEAKQFRAFACLDFENNP